MRALRLIATTWTFLGFFVGTVILGFIVLPMIRLCFGDHEATRRRSRKVVAWTFARFVDALRIQRLLDVDHRPLAAALRKRTPEGAFVLVANHPTLVDVTVLLAALPTMRCVVKTRLFRTPAVGALLRLAGHVQGSDRDGDARRTMQDALAGLAAGDPLLIFPEGTRSPEGGLHDFHRGGFELACRAGVPVVAALLHCDPPVLAKEAPWYRVPARVPRLTLQLRETWWPTNWNSKSRAMANDACLAYRTWLQSDADAVAGSGKERSVHASA